MGSKYDEVPWKLEGDKLYYSLYKRWHIASVSYKLLNNSPFWREKYSSVPIPGSEISLDGGALRAEAQTEKDALIEQLRENLEELSRKNQFEIRNNESNYQQEMLRKVPLTIYTG